MNTLHKYPKLLSLCLTFVLAYALYHVGLFDWLPRMVGGYGYLTMFLGGLLFSFGFTTPFAIVIFVEMAPTVNPLLGALVAGTGALISDLTIFEFVRFSFVDELHRLKRTLFIRRFRKILDRERTPERVRQWVLWAVAGTVIASPLPDELGVSILSGFTDVHGKPFAILSYSLNTIGVFIMLLIAVA